MAPTDVFARLDPVQLQNSLPPDYDAMGQQITAGGADYVLAVKENQGRLHEGY